MKRLLTSLSAAAVVALALTGCASSDKTTQSAESTPPTESTQSDQSAAAVTWSYSGDNGPDSWSDVAATCASTDTSTQSPIDIEESGLVPAAASAELTIHYSAAEFELENNGHTIEAVPDDLRANYITIDGKDFYLQQFHLHDPSEHQLNGKNSDMELHLVNKADDGTIAVIGVLLNVGDSNQTLEELFQKMPTSETTEDTMVELTQEINPAELLPAGSKIAQYVGSLTTPPCTEGVLWNVYETTGSISSEQLAAFQAIYPDNHRPIQSLNGREVDESDAK